MRIIQQHTIIGKRYKLHNTVAVLVFFLWTGYSPDKDENDIVYQRSTSIYETVTPETRTGRMRKALREKAEDLKIHEELVANQLKQQQNLLDERGSGETKSERAIIVSNVLK